MAGSDLVQALERGLLVLELAAEQDGVSVSQVTKALGVKQPTAHNLTRTLLAHGYLVRRSSPVRYAVGPAVEALVRRRAEHLWRPAAEDTVRSLASRLPSATVVLVEWRLGDLVVALRIHPAHPGLLERDPAMRLSPYTSACSQCFQAFAPAPEVAVFRQRYPLGEIDAGRWTDLADLDASLTIARRAGLLVLEDARMYRVAAPVWEAGGRLVAVLGVSAPVDAAFRESSASTLRAACVSAAHDFAARLRQNAADSPAITP